MDIDERLNKLTDRHEALTQSLELLTHDVSRMRGIMDDMMIGIARLAHVADIHKKRISHREEGDGAN